MFLVIEPTLPSNPEFQDVEDIHNCSKCLPARLNVDIAVKCFAVGGSEPVELNLFASEELLSNVHRNYDSYNQMNTITYNLIPTSDNFDTVFKCTVKNPALHVEKAVNTRLYIKGMFLLLFYASCFSITCHMSEARDKNCLRFRYKYFKY